MVPLSWAMRYKVSPGEWCRRPSLGASRLRAGHGPRAQITLAHSQGIGINAGIGISNSRTVVLIRNAVQGVAGADGVQRPAAGHRALDRLSLSNANLLPYAQIIWIRQGLPPATLPAQLDIFGLGDKVSPA